MIDNAIDFVELFTETPAQAPEIVQILLKSMADELARIDWTEHFQQLKHKIDQVQKQLDDED